MTEQYWGPTEMALLKHLHPPKGYAVTAEKWTAMLEDALIFGCDWVERMTDKHNPLLAASVGDLAVRMEAAEQEIADLRRQLAQ